MINLLPPDLKEQIRYAKLNRATLRYLWIIIGVAVVLGGIFTGAIYIVDQQASGVASTVTSSQQVISSLNKTVLPAAEDASNRLAAIQYVQSTQTHFSAVIANLASVLPQGVTITSVTLTGDASTPVTLAMNATTYDEAIEVRDALASSTRIANVDLESISSVTNSGVVSYNVTCVIAFKPGEAQ